MTAMMIGMDKTSDPDDISDLRPLFTEIRDSLRANNLILERLVEVLGSEEKGKQKEEEDVEEDVRYEDEIIGRKTKKAFLIENIGSAEADHDSLLVSRVFKSDKSVEPDEDESPSGFVHPVYGTRVTLYRTAKQPKNLLGLVQTSQLERSLFDSIQLFEPQPQKGNFQADWKFCKSRLRL